MKNNRNNKPKDDTELFNDIKNYINSHNSKNKYILEVHQYIDDKIYHYSNHNEDAIKDAINRYTIMAAITDNNCDKTINTIIQLMYPVEQYELMFTSKEVNTSELELQFARIEKNFDTLLDKLNESNEQQDG